MSRSISGDLPLFMPTQRFMVNWMAGVRYFRFTDDLVFGSVSGSTTVPAIFGQEAYLDTKMVNNLIGVQIGGRGNYFLTRTVSLYAQPTMGVFGNHATSMMHLFDAAGNQGFDNRGGSSTTWRCWARSTWARNGFSAPGGACSPLIG